MDCPVLVYFRPQPVVHYPSFSPSSSTCSRCFVVRCKSEHESSFSPHTEPLRTQWISFVFDGNTTNTPKRGAGWAVAHYHLKRLHALKQVMVNKVKRCYFTELLRNFNQSVLQTFREDPKLVKNGHPMSPLTDTGK